jgi:hypothetical protein
LTFKTAATFIGGYGPAYKFAINNLKFGSCTNVTGIKLNTWYDVNITDPGQLVCQNLTSTTTNNTMSVSIKLVIPADAPMGNFSDIMMATGTSY